MGARTGSEKYSADHYGGVAVRRPVESHKLGL
jgi:hypothetical protein